MKKLIWLAAASLCAASGRALTHTAHYENVLGTSLELRIGAASPEAARRGEEAVLGEIQRQSWILARTTRRASLAAGRGRRAGQCGCRRSCWKCWA